VDGHPIIQGEAADKDNMETSPTTLQNCSQGDTNGTVLRLIGAAPVDGGSGNHGLFAVAIRGDAVRGLSREGYGVRGGSYGDGAGVQGQAVNSVGVHGQSLSDGIGVHGEAETGLGVRGSGSVVGVMGEASDARGFGVWGVNRRAPEGSYGVVGSAHTGVWGDGNIGVVGRGVTEHGIGVEGDAIREGGIGVYGATLATEEGVGVYATAPHAGSTALQVEGSAVFSSAGLAVVPARADRVTVTGPALGPSSLVLAAVQQDKPGVAVRAAVPDVAAGSFTLFLTQASLTETAVAWFVIN
jgi:hypothetical protein